MSCLRYSNVFEPSNHPPDDERLNFQGFSAQFTRVDHLISPNLSTSIRSRISRRQHNRLHPDIMWEFYLLPPHKQHPKPKSCMTSFMPRDLVQTLSFSGWVLLLERSIARAEESGASRRSQGQSQTDPATGVCHWRLHAARRQPPILRRSAGRI